MGVRTQETQTVHSSCKQAYTWGGGGGGGGGGAGEVLRVGGGLKKPFQLQASLHLGGGGGGGGGQGRF